MATDIETDWQSRQPVQKVASMTSETLAWVNGGACDGLRKERIASLSQGPQSWTAGSPFQRKPFEPQVLPTPRLLGRASLQERRTDTGEFTQYLIAFVRSDILTGFAT